MVYEELSTDTRTTSQAERAIVTEFLRKAQFIVLVKAIQERK